MATRPCTACSVPARKLHRALVLTGPNAIRRGLVCQDCARLGWLLVLGAVDLPRSSSSTSGAAAPLRSSSSPAPRRRRRRRDELELEPQPLPKSSRPTVEWRPGIVAELERLRGRRTAEDVHAAQRAELEALQELEQRADAVEQEEWTMEEEQQYQRWKTRLLNELRKEAPAMLKLLATAPELEVTIERRTVQYDAGTLRGRLAMLISAGFFAEPRTQTATRKELKRTGRDVNPGNLSRDIAALVDLGMLTKEPAGYQVTPHAKVRVRDSNNGAPQRA